MGMAESAIGFPNFFYCANRTSGLLTYLVVLPLWIQKKEPFVLGRPLARPLRSLGRLAAWHSRLSNDDGGGNRGHDERGFLSRSSCLTRSH